MENVSCMLTGIADALDVQKREVNSDSHIYNLVTGWMEASFTEIWKARTGAGWSEVRDGAEIESSVSDRWSLEYLLYIYMEWLPR